MAHTNNTGAMLGVPGKGALALISPAAGKNRKLPWTLERIWAAKNISRNGRRTGFWIGVNTQIPNRLLRQAFYAGRLPFANEYKDLRTEACRGQSRLDACLSDCEGKKLWVECKNVSLVEDGVASFPDAPSERGRKHLRELAEIAASGERAAMFYVVQRPDGKCFAPADYIDAEYARLFYEAQEAGVGMYAFEAAQEPDGIALGRQMRILEKFF